MAQIKFGNCVVPQKRTTFLDYTEPFSGRIQTSEPALINCDTSKFGSGIAKANIGTVDYTGVPNSRFMGDYDTIPTMEGSVQVPKESERFQYMPSVDTLHFLTTQKGTRLQAHPTRYYP